MKIDSSIFVSTNAVCRVTRLRSGRPRNRGSISGSDKTSSYFLRRSDCLWGPFSLPLHGDWASSPWIKRSGRGTGHKLPSSFEVEKLWSCNSTSHTCAYCLHRITVTLPFPALLQYTIALLDIVTDCCAYVICPSN
jgi:hypothetical protein